MFRRVALIVRGIITQIIRREFGVPMRIAPVIAMIPFGLNARRKI
jgi:hypothetical protein